MTNEIEKDLFGDLQKKGIFFENPSWESLRNWLSSHDWKINVLSDYPRGEIKFTVRKGFERIEVSGQSDLEVMARAILEIIHRDSIEKEERG